MTSLLTKEIIEWFKKEHGRKWVSDNKLVSWSRKLGIELNHDGRLNEEELFHLFVLAVLWNNEPTYRADKGEGVFKDIKGEYTLSNFREAVNNRQIEARLEQIAIQDIQNRRVFDLLMFIAMGGNVWTGIKQILNSPEIGDRHSDLIRIKKLWGIFNNPRRGAYLTVKTFLIFREIRIQFRNTGRYQYHPIVCCVPDYHVREALKELDVLHEIKKDLNSLLTVSEIVAEHFCKEPYELYDLPLFFWHKYKFQHQNNLIAPGDESQDLFEQIEKLIRGEEDEPG